MFFAVFTCSMSYVLFSEDCLICRFLLSYWSGCKISPPYIRIWGWFVFCTAFTVKYCCGEKASLYYSLISSNKEMPEHSLRKPKFSKEWAVAMLWKGGHNTVAHVCLLEYGPSLLFRCIYACPFMRCLHVCFLQCFCSVNVPLALWICSAVFKLFYSLTKYTLLKEMFFFMSYLFWKSCGKCCR